MSTGLAREVTVKSITMLSKMIIVLLPTVLVCLFISASLPGLVLKSFAQGSQQNGASIPALSSSKPTRKVIIEKVGERLANPVAPIWSIGFRYDFTFLTGEPSDKTRNSYTLNVQPVIPIPVRDKWFLIVRSVLPFIVSTPVAQEGGGFKTRSGFGDMTLITALTPKKISGFKWALGTTWIFPTASKENLGKQKWQLGPTGFAGYFGKKWAAGIFPQQWWSIGGKDRRPETSHANIQYYLWRNLPDGWQVGTGAPNVLIDWKADDDDKVTLPIGLGVAKTVNLKKVPFRIQLEGSYSVVQPDTLSSEWNIRLVVTPFFPGLIKKSFF